MVCTTPHYIYSFWGGLPVTIRSSQGVCQQFTTIGGLCRPRLRMLEPRPVDWGGKLLGTGIMIGSEDQRPVPPSLHYARRAPPNVARE